MLNLVFNKRKCFVHLRELIPLISITKSINSYEIYIYIYHSCIILSINLGH